MNGKKHNNINMVRKEKNDERSYEWTRVEHTMSLIIYVLDWT